MENVRKHRDIKLVTKNKKRNNLECHCHNQTIIQQNILSENLLAVEIDKIQVK